MAQKFTRKGSDGSLTSSVVTDASFAVAVGDLVWVGVTGQEGGTISNVQDTAGNTYVPGTPANTFTLAQCFYTVATAAHANNFVTANFATAVRYKVISVASRDGMAGSPFVTGDIGADAATTIVATASMNATGASNPVIYWVAVASNDRSWDPAVGSGTEIYDSNAAVGFGAHGSAWREPGAAGNYVASSTADSASNLDIAAMVFAQASSGGAQPAAYHLQQMQNQ